MLPRGNHTFVQFPDTDVLMFIWDWVITNEKKVFVIDKTGKRLASEEEYVYLELFGTYCFLESQSCIPHGYYDIPEVYIEQISNCDECNRKYKYDHQCGFFIYLGKKLVVVAGYVDYKPRWDPDLGLYIWEEGEADDTYFMDELGNYRYWLNGDYIGKYLRNK